MEEKNGIDTEEGQPYWKGISLDHSLMHWTYLWNKTSLRTID